MLDNEKTDHKRDGSASAGAFCAGLLSELIRELDSTDMGSLPNPELYSELRRLAAIAFTDQVASTPTVLARQIHLLTEEAAALAAHYQTGPIIDFGRRFIPMAESAARFLK